MPMFSGGFNITSQGGSITSYSLYADLPTTASADQEAFVEHILDGDAFGPYYFKFVSGVWSPRFTNTQLNYIQSNPIPLTYPPLLRFAYVSAGQDFGSSLNNDGSLWFWSAGGTGTFQSLIKNIENYNIESIRLFVESKDDTSSSMLGYAAKVGSNWISDTTDVTPPSGGTYASPTMLWAPALTLTSPIIPGDTFKMHVTQGSGLITAGQTFSDLWPTSGLVTNPNFNPGDHLTEDQSNNIGIGPLQSMLQLTLPAAATPRALLAIFGDSVSAEKRAIADENSVAKEGIWFRANAWLRANNKQLRAYSRGQGGAPISDIFARVRAHLPTLIGNFNGICVSVPTWNSAPVGVSGADSQWADYLILEAEVQAAGLICIPIMIHPPTTRNSVDQLAGWDRMEDLIRAHGGLVFRDITADTDGINLITAESADNVHMNDIGSTRCGPFIAQRLYDKFLTYYPGI